MLEVLNKYDNSADEDSTVADLLADILSVELGDEGLGILQDDITVSYYEHVRGSRVEYGNYDRSKDIKSLMWTIPFGQEYLITLPALDFELGNKALPLQLNVDSSPPEFSIEWKFTLSFGFDEEDGFFLYTHPGEESELFIKADFTTPSIDVDAKLLYFLNLEMENAEIEFGGGVFVDIDKEAALRVEDDEFPNLGTSEPTKQVIFLLCSVCLCIHFNTLTLFVRKPSRAPTRRVRCLCYTSPLYYPLCSF